MGNSTTHAYVDALAAKLGRRPTNAEIRAEEARIDAAFKARWAAYESTWTDEERARVARASKFTWQEELAELVRSVVGAVVCLVLIVAAIWLIVATWAVSMWVLVIAAGVVLGGLVLGALARA